MFERWGAVVVRRPVRVIVTWLVAVLALGGVGFAVLGLDGPAAVMGNSQSDLLPDGYESARAAKLAEQGFPTPKNVGATAASSRSPDRGVKPTDQHSGSSMARDRGENQW